MSYLFLEKLNYKTFFVLIEYNFFFLAISLKVLKKRSKNTQLIQIYVKFRSFYIFDQFCMIL